MVQDALKLNKQKTDFFMCPLAQLTIDSCIIELPASGSNCLILQPRYFALQHLDRCEMRTGTRQYS